ncbi:low affinity iron permease family protein [Sphingobium phenoxybenzoativorans]|uniref:Low affinity iron permease family protein n=1 Tax=Sphingobium phenoxybenzoativorans TaxID=1592790 RepID=A0A975K8B0_9SPHN|nr:low affinity iron permease family protein [Sphingobium phenoxybenzoativorans]QUT05302.1 low affinity iron permease family protein [Sphingobium phenoxybenzoativorans]
MDRIFAEFSHKVASWAGRPGAFMVALAVVLIWGCTGPLFHYSDTWQLVINTGTTIVTFLMVFLIQNAQNRDAAAIQAKLDELIRASRSARNGFIGIEHLTEAQLQQISAALEKNNDDDAKHSKLLLDRVIQRR